MDLRTWKLVHDLAQLKTFWDQAPTAAEVVRYLKTCFPGAERWAEPFYRAMARQGWKDRNRNPLRDWRLTARRYASRAHIRTLMQETPKQDPAVVNGRRYHLWPQFVERKDEWIGGTLEDLSPDAPEATTITDITFGPNGDDGALFEVVGKSFTCSCDVQYLAVDPALGGDGWLGFVGYGGLEWRMRKPINGNARP